LPFATGSAPHGDIAQLGERVLCKHEVVGSIPSVSTILLGPGAAVAATSRTGCRDGYLEHEFAAVTQQQGPIGSAEHIVGEDISDIVKRECGRWGSESCEPWRSCSASIRRFDRKRSDRWSFCDRVVTVIRFQRLPVSGHRSRERSSALRAFGGCLGAERR
jgi:hypothetical protein